MDAAGLDRNVMVGRSRWFVGHHVSAGAEVEIDLWLGRNPLSGENLAALDKDKNLPENIDAMLDKVVVPKIVAVFEKQVRLSLRRQALYG